jgi:CelD/BcsL family acetyltransferase involved in cellulose biosynthesis
MKGLFGHDVARPDVRGETMSSEVDVRVADSAEWDRLLLGFAERTVFHSTAWIELLTSTFDLESVLLRVDDGRGCAALWPCLLMRKGPFRICGSPLPGWSTPYMGPLFREDADRAMLLARLVEQPALADASYVACRVMDDGHQADLGPFGFECRQRFETYVVDLAQTEQELWDRLKGECRSRIRKARKSGVTVRSESDPDFVPQMWQMANEVFAKSGKKPTFSRKLLERMWEQLHPRGLLEVVSAFHEGRRIATLVLPHDDRRMYYWAGGSTADSLRFAPNNLLHWEAIVAARAAGLRTYDFIATEGGAGRFKRTFGPDVEATAVHWERSRSRVSSTLKRVYELAARRRGRVTLWR